MFQLFGRRTEPKAAPAPTRVALLEVEDTVWLQVGKSLWEGAPLERRSDLWRSVLHGKDTSGERARQQYPIFLNQAIPPRTLTEIEKDVPRSYPEYALFASREGQNKLTRVLKAYAAKDPAVGYCQGMNFLVGLLLMYVPNEDAAFGVLHVLMIDRGLRVLYLPDMSSLQHHLWVASRLLSERVRTRLESACVLPVLYMPSWLLTTFASEFPAAMCARLLDVMLLEGWQRPLIRTAVTLMAYAQPRLMQRESMEDMLAVIKEDLPTLPLHKLQGIVTEALRGPWGAEEEALLNDTAGFESISDSVSRVQEAADLAARSQHGPGVAQPSGPGSLIPGPAIAAIGDLSSELIASVSRHGRSQHGRSQHATSTRGPSPDQPQAAAASSQWAPWEAFSSRGSSRDGAAPNASQEEGFRSSLVDASPPGASPGNVRNVQDWHEGAACEAGPLILEPYSEAASDVDAEDLAGASIVGVLHSTILPHSPRSHPCTSLDSDRATTGTDCHDRATSDSDKSERFYTPATSLSVHVGAGGSPPHASLDAVHL